jgi:hypothetical protein
LTKSDKLAKRPNEELSFDQAERVLHRALELQQRDAGKTSISLTDVEAMAAELGVPADTVRAAYREVRTQALVPAKRSRGALDVVIGDARLTVSRTLPGRSPGDVQRRVREYLEGQLFRVKRNLGDRTVWEPAESIGASIQRAVDFSARYELPASMELDVLVVATGPDSDETDVVIVADFRGAQGQTALATGIGAVLLAGAGVAGGLLLTPLAYAAGAALAAGSLGVGRLTFRADRRRATDALERLLDELQHS